jgi:hypothetical protein
MPVPVIASPQNERDYVTLKDAETAGRITAESDL